MPYVITDPYIDIKGNSCTGVCPVKAILRQGGHPGEVGAFIGVNAAHYRCASK